LREDVHTTRDQLLDVRIAGGQVSESGIRTNIRVALEYIENWLDGRGAVGIANLMEDSATAEISRTQLRQWVSQGVTLADGRRCTEELYRKLRQEETEKLAAVPGATARLSSSAELMDHLVLGAAPEDFLTLPAYEQLG